MPFPVLHSPDGRVSRVVTSQEELDQLKADGYTQRKAPAKTDEKTDEKSA